MEEFRLAPGTSIVGSLDISAATQAAPRPSPAATQPSITSDLPPDLFPELSAYAEPITSELRTAAEAAFRVAVAEGRDPAKDPAVQAYQLAANPELRGRAHAAVSGVRVKEQFRAQKAHLAEHREEIARSVLGPTSGFEVTDTLRHAIHRGIIIFNYFNGGTVPTAQIPQIRFMRFGGDRRQADRGYARDVDGLRAPYGKIFHALPTAIEQIGVPFILPYAHARLSQPEACSAKANRILRRWRLIRSKAMDEVDANTKAHRGGTSDALYMRVVVERRAKYEALVAAERERLRDTSLQAQGVDPATAARERADRRAARKERKAAQLAERKAYTQAVADHDLILKAYKEGGGAVPPPPPVPPSLAEAEDSESDEGETYMTDTQEVLHEVPRALQESSQMYAVVSYITDLDRPSDDPWYNTDEGRGACGKEGLYIVYAVPEDLDSARKFINEHLRDEVSYLPIYAVRMYQLLTPDLENFEEVETGYREGDANLMEQFAKMRSLERKRGEIMERKYRQHQAEHTIIDPTALPPPGGETTGTVIRTSDLEAFASTHLAEDAELADVEEDYLAVFKDLKKVDAPAVTKQYHGGGAADA